MSSPSTSYTLRIPKDLRRLLEAEAARTECTLAATVVNMCWMGLEVRGGGFGELPAGQSNPSDAEDTWPSPALQMLDLFGMIRFL